MEGDPDVFILGSRNGVGKTSVLECILWLFTLSLTKIIEKDNSEVIKLMEELLLDQEIRVGCTEIYLKGNFSVLSQTTSTTNVEVYISKNKESSYVKIDNSQVAALVDATILSKKHFYPMDDPFILQPLLLFGSYRRLTKTNPSLDMLINEKSSVNVSLFKKEVLRLMMSRGGMLEGVEDNEDSYLLDELNSLIEKFAGGHLSKLRQGENNALALRINPINSRETFSFDELSSGQKEIISTFYMILKHTRNFPGLVLIDEPELHLNVEWQSKFIRMLKKLVPGNQYIMATHSEEIFGSVDKKYRGLLEKE